MSTLYELTADFDSVMDLLYTDADEQTIFDTLDSIESAIEDKADNYAKIIVELEGNINALKAEENRLKTKRQRLERSIDWMKENLFNSMKTTGKTKFKTELFNFSIVKNGGKLPLTITAETEYIPKAYLVVKEEPDKEAIRKALEAGEELSFARLEERGERLSIK